jgi:hypothetical protein
MGRIAMRCFGWYSTARSERIAETGLIVLALAKCGEELDSGFALRWTVGAGEYLVQGRVLSKRQLALVCL